MSSSSIHEAYSDESGSSSSRFQAIGVVSGPSSKLVVLRRQLGSVLEDKGIREVKFEEVRGHRPKVEAASCFYDLVIDHSAKRDVRIDVLTWDSEDSRHRVIGRDDTANLHRMYYKVLVDLGRRWSADEWKLVPDENSTIDWGEIQDFLGMTRLNRRRPELLELFESSEGKKFFRFHSVTPRSSHAEPLIQLADLLAGLATFSRTKGVRYVSWLSSEEAKRQPVLFDREENGAVEPSKGDIVRFHLLKKFCGLCRRRRLGVSIRTRNHLHTFDPRKPVNFWNYEPQHDMDKAPTRSPDSR